MKRFLTLAAVVVLASGCATNDPDRARIIDYDPELDERYYVDDDRFLTDEEAAKINHVVVADKKSVMVDVMRGDPMWDDNSREWLQVWNVFMTNTGAMAKCVAVRWKLMDFQYATNHPTYVYVPAADIVHAGTMTQTTMTIDGVTVAPPPSGYADAIDVMPPTAARNPLDRCTFDIDDGEVVERVDN